MGFRTRFRLGVLSGLLLIVLAYAFHRLLGPRAVEGPPRASFEVTGPEAGWPPRPRGVTNVAQVPWQEIPGSLTDAVEAQIRAAAVQDPRVRELLGERFAYITTDEVEPPKGTRPDSSAPLATTVTFYSHAKNTAVLVRMRGTSVESAEARQGYQPPEGAEEVAAAVKLARADARLAGKLEGLTGDAILTFSGREQRGYGHRLLYVTFSKEEEDLPRYRAVVDLTEQVVVEAGALGTR